MESFKKYVAFLLLLSVCLLQAQKKDGNYWPAQYKSGFCNSNFQTIVLPAANTTDNIAAYLKANVTNLQGKKTDLKLNYRKESLAGIHYSFIQLYAGVPVYQSEIKVNTDKHNTILSIFDNSFNTSDWNINITGAGSHPVIAINPKTEEAVLANRSIINHSKEVISTGPREIIYQQDLNMYAAPDSLVTGKIFNPDPLTTAGQFYDTNTVYANHNDSDFSWMDAQQQTVQFNALFDGDSFRLLNDYVRVLDFDPPAIRPVVSVTPQFKFNRSQSGFEDVNAFYHLTHYRNYINSLGFDAANETIDVDTHAQGETSDPDNSFFAPGYSPRRIFYGIGGVNDAEDADVIIHEYGHFISYNAAPGSNNGKERNSLDEAFGDYNAASYSRSLNTFNQDWVYNWDGHNQFWKGRVVNSTKVYPNDLVSSSIYPNAEIWSAVLFALNKEIGRGPTDSLVLETHYNYASNISMLDAAQILIASDELLFNGQYFCPIYKHLLEHGLITFNRNSGCALTGINEEPELGVQVIQNGNRFTVIQNEAKPIWIDIYSLTGQKIISLTTDQAAYTYTNTSLANGLYLLNIHSGNASAGFKWLKTL